MSLENQPNSKLILSVPHPAFNNWVKAKYKDEIEELKNFLTRPQTPVWGCLLEKQ